MNRQQWARRPGRSSKWCSKTKRARVYARDGHRCIYCSAGEGPLTLDHLKPRVRGGSHDAANLVTACRRCNAARGALPLAAFCRGIALRTGEPAREIELRIRRQRAKIW
jgi:5-methylcytosine-specific restriction endonuclease McrA